jgi:hypothetical protein
MQQPKKLRFVAAALLCVAIFFVASAGVGFAQLIITQHTPGHIRIVNGTNAGLTVSPVFMEFGNVTWGQTISKQVVVTNNGNCVEHVNATATQGSILPNPGIYIPQLFPAHSMNVTASYNTAYITPGDYTFGFDWIATCI